MLRGKLFVWLCNMSEWIKCSDGIPLEHIPVLVADKSGNVFIGVWDDYEGWDSISTITHWQSLPEPPKDE